MKANLLVLLLFADFWPTLSGSCSNMFLIPMFADGICYIDTYSDNSTCSSTFATFMQNCNDALEDQLREYLTVLFVDYKQPTGCSTGPNSECDHISVHPEDVQLIPGRTYNLRTEFKKVLDSLSDDCLDKSMAIFVSNIPCNKIGNYPDINEMFNTDLNGFVKELHTHYYLHTEIFWFKNDKIHNTFWPCPDLEEYNYTTTDGYVNVNITDYETFEDSGGVCRTLLPPRRPDGKDSTSSNKNLIIGVSIGCSVVLVLIVLLIVFFVYRIRRRYLESKIEFFASKHNSIARQLFFRETVPKDDLELMPRELKIEANFVLGQGVTAVVYKGQVKKKRNGQLTEIDVAVKFAHAFASKSTREAMLQEIELMKQLGLHEHLLTMIGYVKLVDNPVIATEYCLHGDLLKILRKHPLHYMSDEQCDKVKVCLLIADLIQIASQVCSAMIYLSSLNFVHRDIAARNILLNDRRVAKLGDFGLCKHIDELLMDQRSGRLPVRHMPYEVLKFGRFSEKTDVWSFGVLLWEMLTGGQTAFADIETEDLVDFLDQGGRPEFPTSVPEEIVQLANNLCLQRDANSRSNFVEIKEEIDKFFNFPVL